ncbi:GNAT family N-acetyltransferase [Flavobacterium sp. J49]|uniref:GNAT family N-acetyltransferase n=1 Tax=Flavobacterium sp. J49 TaxID=2718534 RepID=UPI001593F6DA|nr:GNAT family N-acetyltransferase [Flavobacterium sp. J49]MBF6642468.1 GNAT family N-acetyltransferase [Flavobacterium sp. J49]NIC03714.1 GNAT family N-acetyltransferase [Flavobacterium sp. J49]
MKPIIETSRCYLRELSVADAQHFYDLNADAEVIKYTGDKAFDNVMEAKSFLENYNQYQLYGYGRWAVIAKSDGEFLGWCGLKNSPDLEEVDLGFRFFRKYWNQGYATETAKACIEYGFNHLQLTKIVGRAMELNRASIKVLEKTGMTFVAKFEFDLHDGVLYQIEKNFHIP